MLKRLFILAAAVCLLLCVTGCAAAAPDTARVRIVCTAFPAYDFLREITAGVEGVSLTLLLKPGQESHDYDPSSGDILTIHACHLFVYVGGESDSWIDDMLTSVDLADKTVVALMDAAEALPEEPADGTPAHRHGDGGEYDEHIWTAPANAAAIVAALTDALAALDGQYAPQYRANAAAYTEKLTALDTAFADAVHAAAQKTIVVADRFPLLYFCKAYGLSYRAAFAGCAASVEPSSATVQLLIDEVRQKKIPVVFQMELSDGRLAQTVAENTGCRIATFYACHNLSKADFDAGEGYLSLMYKNLAALKEALGVCA